MSDSMLDSGGATRAEEVSVPTWLMLSLGGYLVFAVGLFTGFLMGLDTRRDPDALPLPRPEVKPATELAPLPRNRAHWPYQNSQN